MHARTIARRPRVRRLPVIAILPLLLAALLAGPAAAQVTKPWVPAGDSLLRDVTTARMRFMKQQGDTIGGDNFLAFDLVGRLGRKLLQSLGRNNVLQAQAIEGALDSLGLDTEVAIDHANPGMAFLLVRNPFRVSSNAVGFLYWYVQNDLRMQGIGFPPARDARLRAWWTGRGEVPYEAVILCSLKGTTSFKPGMKLLRMAPDASHWNLLQYEGYGPDFGDRATVTFVDVNNDAIPELLSYHPVDDDTFFVLRPGVPPIVNEFLYTERPEGFVLHDARTIPGPAEALRMWANMLVDHEYERAKRLMLKPEKLAEAIANGWPQLRGPEAWVVEYGEKGQAWPEWLALRIKSARGVKRWIFHFYIQDGHWVIRDWIPVTDKPAPGVSSMPSEALRDSTKARKP